MEDIFGNIVNMYDNYTLFQDEAGCKDSNFFYHGFLLVKNESGRQILDEILKIKGEASRYSEITFKEIKKDDYKVPVAIGWLKLADKLLQEGKIRFYVLAINKNNLKNFWDNSWSFDKNVYLRFFEIGLNSLSGWFKNDSSLNKQLHISHVFYEYGPYNDERGEKIKWLKNLNGYHNVDSLHSDPRRQKQVNEKYEELSNLIQFTDILLGVTKYSFIKINEKHVGKQKCIDCFIDIIERFNNNKTAYRDKSRYYKRYALQFFPTASNITRDEFISNSLESFIKKGSFYVDRLTYRQQCTQNVNGKLF